MDRLKHMKETLMSIVSAQLANPAAADTKELGEAVDMIKDLEEAIYYCSVVEAMEDTKKEKEYEMKHPRPQYQPQYYTPYIRYIEPYISDRDEWEADRIYGKMYYGGRGRNADGTFAEGNTYGSRGRGGYGYSDGGNGSSNGNNGGSRGYDEYPMMSGSYPREIRDVREGRSPMSRRGYMESKETHRDKNVQMQELEKYMQELSTDITEMINGASPEEKTLLQQKLSALATKIK